MKPYPQYKNSGVEWIGEVPEHWKSAKLKYSADVVLGKMIVNDDKGGMFSKPYLRAANLQWFKADISDVKEMWFSGKEIERLRLKKDDLLMSEGGEVGRTCIWNEELDECYLQNSVHKITFNQDNNAKYHLYQSYVMGQLGYFDSIVNRISIAHLTGEKVKEVCFLTPPFQEQTAIAAFLDRKTAEIDSIIAKKERLIELYEEEKAAVINHAVTKGIDPAAKMKDSGIEWLGEIPENWEVKRLKYVVESMTGGGTPSTENKEFWNGNIPWVSPKDMKVNYIYKTEDYVTEKAIECSSTNLIHPERLLLVVRSGILKHSFPVAINKVAACLNQDMKAIKPIDSIYLNFLFWKIKGISGYILTQCNKMGATVDSIEISELLDVIITYPKTQEQLAIVQHIETKCSYIDAIISKFKRQIELLKEYRTALISEAVTGKIDVRNQI